MRYDSLMSVFDNVCERLRVIEALKEGAKDPFSKLELVIEEGAYLKVLAMIVEAQKTRVENVTA